MVVPRLELLPGNASSLGEAGFGAASIVISDLEEWDRGSYGCVLCGQKWTKKDMMAFVH